MTIRLTTPLSEDTVRSLHAGDQVLLSGTVYTARDAAHLRMLDCIENGKPLPFDLKDQVIYYAGPTPTPPGRPIGSIGPTTSVRMDAATPTLLAHGDDDDVVAFENSVRLCEKLKANGVASELVTYPGEGHFIRFSPIEMRQALMQRVLEWTKIYL